MGSKATFTRAKQEKRRKDHPSIFVFMRRLLLLMTFLTGLSVCGQQRKNRSFVRLLEDGQTLQIEGQLEWQVHWDTLPAVVWLELWPIALGSDHSVIAEQWLEDQQTRFHFSKEDERIQVQNLAFRDGNGRLHAYGRGRSPELLRFQKDQIMEKGADRLSIHYSYELYFPEEELDGMGLREDGLLLQHFLPRISYFENGRFAPSPMNRAEDRNLQEIHWILELDLPPPYYPVRSMPGRGPVKLVDEAFDQGDFSPLKERRAYRFDAPQYSGSHQLLISKAVRTLVAPQKGLRLLETQTVESTPSTDAYIKHMRGMQSWLKERYGIEDSLHWTLIWTGSDLPESVEPGLLFINEDLKEPYPELHFASRYFRSFTERHLAGVRNPWLGKGIGHYLAHTYMEAVHPGMSLGGPFENKWLARFFRVDELPLGYEKQILYLYLARQGLDQNSTDSTEAFTRGTYEAQMRAKSAMQLNYLHDFLGDRKFRIGLSRYLRSKEHSVASFRENMAQASAYRSVDWYFEDLLPSPRPMDFRLNKTEACPSVFVVRSDAPKGNQFPYPVQGFMKDSLVMTEWMPQQLGKKSKNFYPDDYDRVVVADPLRYPDLYGKNNEKAHGDWLPWRKPLEFQLYASLENPSKHQVYWMPSMNFNAYDGLMPGLNLYNSTLIPKKFEYRLAPEYSTQTGELVGFASLAINWPLFEGKIRLMTLSTYYIHYHYAPKLGYSRISPTLTLHFRKTAPRSPFIRKLRMRNIYVDAERTSSMDDAVTAQGYSVFNLNYSSEFTSILNPRTLRVDMQVGDYFSKLSVEWDQRWMLPNRKWLVFRVFGGWMPYNNNPKEQTLFDFGLSGTRDYLFDYHVFGRSDETGIWSQQFFATDGGFRSNTRMFGRSHVLAANLSVPLFNVLGVYGDIGTLGGPVEWGYGIRVAILTDFLEWYFPIQGRGGTYLERNNYFSYTRFTVDLSIDQIVTRLRRGFY